MPTGGPRTILWQRRHTSALTGASPPRLGGLAIDGAWNNCLVIPSFEWRERRAGLGWICMDFVSFAGAWRRWRPLLLAGSAILFPASALGQQAEQAQPSPPPAQIGPPQLRDFQLTPRERIVTQPRPAPQPQAQQPTATPPPAAQRPAAERPTGTAQPRAAAPVQRAPAPATAPVAQPPAAPVPSPAASPPTADLPVQSAPLPTPQTDVPPPVAQPSPTSVVPEPVPAQDNGLPLWLLLLGGLGLGIGAYAFFRRSRRPLALPAPTAATATAGPAAPRAPRADPVPRAWIEVELRPERTTADPAESIVEFEMTIRNTGGSTAKNLQLQAKLVCSTPEQDKELTAFQRLKPGEHRTLDIPDIPPGEELTLKGRVDAKQDDLKAMRVDQRLLFVPLVAVNAFYDWGTVRKGQTSKSFLIGRERTDSPTKMAPFRLDLGPRVYRTLGMRPYKVERRV